MLWQVILTGPALLEKILSKAENVSAPGPWFRMERMLHMILGDLIAELRQDYGLNQKDLADILKVSVATISHYESEKSFPDLATLVKLADYFGVSTDYLLGRTRLRMDFETFRREVKLTDGTTTSMDQVMQKFIKLSDRSQADIVNLMNLFLLRDDLRYRGIIHQNSFE